MWTPPHFWALALWKKINADYAKAGVPMLPVVAGRDETRRQILIYTLLLVPVTLAARRSLARAGWLYAAGDGGARRACSSTMPSRSTASARASEAETALQEAVRLLDPLAVPASSR